MNNIFAGSPHGLVEGPHLFKRGGWYYLTTAEGGTGYDHAVTMARSRRIEGPYELHPNVHLLTSKDAPDAPLQRAGHGQIVETPDGGVYHTHLCSRPLKGLNRSPLGRETAIQKCVWGEDGWLRLAHGGQVPAVDVPAPFDAPPEPQPLRRSYSFLPDAGLPIDFQWLRTPHPERILSLAARPGWLRLYARELIGSWFEQALVARRQEHFAYRAETELDFHPRAFQQTAGLTAYYNRTKFHCLAVGWDEKAGRSLTLLSCEGDYPEGRLSFPLEAPHPAPRRGNDSPRGFRRSRKPSVRLRAGRRMAPRRAGPRRLDSVGRSGRRRALLLHRRVRRPRRVRRRRRGHIGRFPLFRLRGPRALIAARPAVTAAALPFRQSLSRKTELPHDAPI